MSQTALKHQAEIERFAKQIFGDKPGEELRRHIDVVARLHVGQCYGKLPYTVHLFSVARIATMSLLPTVSSVRDVLTLFALYHDAVEDTGLTLDSFIKSFDDLDASCKLFVRTVMDLLTDGEGETRKERKAALKMKWDRARKKSLSSSVVLSALEVAAQVKMADRLSHLEHIHSVLSDKAGIFSKDDTKRAKKFLKMYRKEHEGFLATVSPHDHPLKRKLEKFMFKLSST